MSTSPAAPQVLHALPGRVRIHLPGWSARERGRIEARLRQITGVRSAVVAPSTGNVLIHFDPRVTDPTTLLAALRTVSAPGPTPSPQPSSPLDIGRRPHAVPGSAPAARPDPLRSVAHTLRARAELWWDVARLALRVTEVFAGASVVSRVNVALTAAEALLRLKRRLGRPAA